MNETGDVSHASLAEEFRRRHEAILRRYELELKEAGSRLLYDTQTRRQALKQASSIIDEVREALLGCNGARGPGLLLSREIGKLRAAGGVHPTESLLAAGKLIESITEVAAEWARDEDSVGVLFQVQQMITDIVLRRVGEAASAYTAFLLEELRLASEHERRRISRDLHDRVGYSLNAAHLQLELAGQSADLDGGTTLNRIRVAHEMVGAASTAIRQVMNGLRLDVVEQSFGEALQAQARRLTPDGTTVRVSVNGQEEWLSGSVRSEVYLILREAMRNALVHSRARNVAVVVNIAPHEVRASVLDDGVGFDPGRDAITGSGLRTMRERADLAGGSLRIDSGLGRGSCVEAAVPLPGFRDGTS